VASLDYSHRRLVNIFGPERVSRHPAERLMHSRDFAFLPKAANLQWKLIPDFVVLPKRVEEVSALVNLAYEAGLLLVPHGGGSGLAGGAVPNRGGVLVDMRQMNRVVKVDADRRRITVQAGMTWKEAADFAAHKGLFLPVVPQGAPASTIAGWYSSGGVGIGSMKYGSARDVVVDAEAVLPNGDAIHTADPNADGDLAFANLNPAFFGGEGTIGILTEVTLQTYPKPEEIRPLSYSTKDLWSVRDIVPAIADSDLEPYHVSIIDPMHLAFVKATRHEGLDPQGLLNVVFDGPKDEVNASEKELDRIMEEHGAKKLPETDARAQWDGRFDLYPARRLSGGLVVAESLVPTGRFPDVLRSVGNLIKRLKMQVAVNSFLVDRNTVAVNPYLLMDEQHPLGPTSLSFVKKFDDAVLRVGGHPQGLGLFHAFNFDRMHKGAQGLYTSVKAVFDPHYKVNPGKMVEVWTRYALPLIDTIPPEIMRFGLDLAAVVRSLKPTRDRYVTLGGAR